MVGLFYRDFEWYKIDDFVCVGVYCGVCGWSFWFFGVSFDCICSFIDCVCCVCFGGRFWGGL